MREDDLTTLAKGDGSGVRAPTMRDVAALAGVSLKTVSRVVNREPGVSPELASRVLDAVALLGYRHNLTASSLRRADQKTATIGLLLEDISNPFSSGLHRAIEDVASARGTLVLASSSDEDPDRQRDLLHALVSRRVDGLIAVPASGNQSRLLSDRRLGRPMVLVARPAHGAADRAEPHHPRRHPRPPATRPAAPGRAGELRRLPARRPAGPARVGGRAGPHRHRAHGRRAAVRAPRRRPPAAAARRRADPAHRSRLRRDPPRRSAACAGAARPRLSATAHRRRTVAQLRRPTCAARGRSAGGSSTRSASRSTRNSSGGASVTASPSIPAGRTAGAASTRRVALVHRAHSAPGRARRASIRATSPASSAPVLARRADI